MKGNDNMQTIHTERLMLTPLGMKYLETVHEYASDPENTEYMLCLPNETIEETKEFVQNAQLEWAKDKPSFYEFAILYEKQHIGAVSIYLNEDASGELGWIINKRYWRQGITYEAASALLQYAKKELNVHHFIAHCDSENIASYKIMEKLGMSRTGASGGRKNRGSEEERTEYVYELHI